MTSEERLTLLKQRHRKMLRSQGKPINLSSREVVEIRRKIIVDGEDPENVAEEYGVTLALVHRKLHTYQSSVHFARANDI